MDRFKNKAAKAKVAWLLLPSMGQPQKTQDLPHPIMQRNIQ